MPRTTGHTKPPKLIDPYQRHLNYLRVSITDRCNLRCLYCNPDNMIPKLEHADILTYEEILRVVRVAIGLGITKIRITGGEPLVRKGVDGFLKQLTAIEGLLDLSLTTNGIALGDHLEALWATGIRRLNISLDSLQPQKYRQITGRDQFETVWQNINRAVEMGFSPIKLNVVALRGYNEDELLDLARLSLTRPFWIRFIEYMPIGQQPVAGRQNLTVDDIKAVLAPLGELTPVKRNVCDGPAERFTLKHAHGEIGFISAMSHHFCQTCNRLRLTASGQLRACLLSDSQFDLATPLRQGATDKDLAEIFKTAVRTKPAQHNLQANCVNSQMSSIGG